MRKYVTCLLIVVFCSGMCVSVLAEEFLDVSLTSPSSGAYLKGTLTLTAYVTSTSEVTKVEFFYNTLKIGEDTTPPYSVDWNTTTVADGSYSLTAKASDIAGNYAVSEPVAVIVDNAPPYDCSITIIDEGYIDLLVIYTLNWITVRLTLEAHDDESGVGAAYLYIYGDVPLLHTKPEPLMVPWPLGEERVTVEYELGVYSRELGEFWIYGEFRIYVEAIFVDKAGNVSASVFETIIIDVGLPISWDREPPYDCRIVINEKDEYTDSATVTVMLGARDDESGVETAYIYGDMPDSLTVPWSFVVPWHFGQEMVTVELSEGDGKKTVCARFKDGWDNESELVCDTIILDTTPPTCTITGPSDNQGIAGTYDIGGTANDANFKQYELEYGVGREPTTWYDIGANPRTTAVTSGVLEKWNMTTVSDSVYTVRLTVEDKAGNTSSDSITVIIVDNTARVHNTPPVANHDAYRIAEDQMLIVNAENGVLANDTDVDGDPLMVILVSGVSNGRLILPLNGDGSFTYFPGQDFIGIDTFTYKANDGFADSDIATVTITVYPVYDAPYYGCIIINDEDPYTNSRDVTLKLYAHDDESFVVLMGFSNKFDNDTTYVWEPYSTSAHWTLSEGDGLKIVYAMFEDAEGNKSLPAFDTIILDTTPPTSMITSPFSGAYLRDMMTFSANADDINGIDKVEFFYDTAKIGADTTSPYSVDWNTTTITDGSYTLTARAWDVANNSATSDSVKVTVDNTPPTCTMTSSDSVDVPMYETLPTRTITDSLVNQVIAGIYDIKGAVDDDNFKQYTLEYGIGTSPTTWYDIGVNPRMIGVTSGVLGNWNTTTVSDSVYTVRLTVEDKAGNISSFSVIVKVENKAPPIPGLHDDFSDVISAGAVLLPQEFMLLQNFPNPFNSMTTIPYTLPRASAVRLVVYDLRGSLVRVLVDSWKEPGYYQVLWDGRDSRGQEVSSGVYIVCLEAGERLKQVGFSRSRKIALIR